MGIDETFEKPDSTVLRMCQVQAHWPGALILSACPTLPVKAGNGHHKSLIEDWQVSQVHLVITLLEQADLNRTGMTKLLPELELSSIDWCHFPIQNMHTPATAAIPRLKTVIQQTAGILAKGGSIFIHCHAGLGRTGLISATILTSFGIEPEQAITMLRKYRPGSIETQSQEDFVRDWDFRLPEFPPGL